jgi:hypothetical protein
VEPDWHDEAARFSIPEHFITLVAMDSTFRPKSIAGLWHFTPRPSRLVERLNHRILQSQCHGFSASLL